MTSTEIATTTTEAPALPAVMPGTPNAAAEMLRAHTEVMKMAFDLASAMVKTAMVPSHFRLKAEDATAAILYGAELGLNPIQSLQQVIGIHGKPSIEARTMVALLKAKGYRFKKIENTNTVATVQGWAPGDPEPEEVTWTIEDAVLAEFVPQIDPKTGDYAQNGNGKLKGNMKYLTQPRQMLWAKACAELCRQLAPDVLLGISYTREDLESEPGPAPVRVESERVTAAEVLGTEAPAAAAPIQDWTPPEEPAGESTSGPDAGSQPAAEQPPVQDASVVDEPPAEQPAEQPAASAKPSTRIQQKKIARLFAEPDDNGEGAVTDPTAVCEAISHLVKRTITSANDLTWDEAIEVIAYLEGDGVPVDAPAGDAQ